MSTIDANERGLLVVTNLSTGGNPKLQKLYEWLDANAINLANLMMKSHYLFIDSLTGNSVTSTNLVNQLNSLAQDNRIKVLDVFLVLHGTQDSLYFDNGPKTSTDLGDQIQAANLSHRLRLLYSTACYGANHAPDFIRAGFRVASGAIGVCANGPYDYPTQLYNWREGGTYKSVVKAGNNPIGLIAHDTIAQALGFTDVNSEKIIVGKKFTRIYSEAI